MNADHASLRRSSFVLRPIIMEVREQGIAAAKAGRRTEARELLTRAVQTDERDEQAWLWLAGVLDDPVQMRHSLDTVLALNPGNERARQGLAWIDARYGPRPIVDDRRLTTDDPQLTTDHRLVEPQYRHEERVDTADVALQDEHVAQRTPETVMVSTTLPTSLLPPLEPPAPLITTTVPSIEEPLSAQAPGVAGRAPTPYTPQMPSPTQPCPYCGASVFVTRETCLTCGKSLMVRGATGEKRSVWLVVLVVLLALLSVVSVLGLIAQILLQLGQTSAGVAPPLNGRAIGSVLGVLLYAILAVSLWRKQRVAYYIAWGLLALIFLSGILGGSAALSGLNAPGGVFIFLIVTLLLICVVPAVLLALSYRDFFGSKERLALTVEPNNDPATHYNKGLDYQRKGMWYIAAQEWQAALEHLPNDIKSLHALGLAYAQLKRSDEARATLDRAIALAPDDKRLRESREFVDKVAS